MNIVQIWLFCAALVLFIIGLTAAYFYRKDIIEFFKELLYRLRGIGRSLYGVRSAIEETADAENILKIATTNFQDTAKVLSYLSIKENKELQYMSYLKTPSTDGKDTIRFVDFDKFVKNLSEDFNLTQVYRMWNRIYYKIHKPGTVFYLMVDQPMYLENKRINYNLDLGAFSPNTLILDQVQFACNPSECNVKEDYLNEVYLKSSFVCKVLPTNFKEKSNIFIPVYGDDNRYSFRRVTVNSFSKYFDSNINLNYNNFNIKIGAATLSCSPADTFQYCCELLSTSNDNLFLEGRPGTGKTSFMSMLKSKLSNTPNTMVFSLDAQTASTLFSDKCFSQTMADFIQQSDFRKRSEDENEEKVSYVFFIEDGDSLLSSVMDENGKKTLRASAILDMLDGEKKTLYNMKFVLSSNTPLESYDEVVQRRFKRHLLFTPLTLTRATDKIAALEEQLANQKDPKFYIDHIEVKEILDTAKKNQEGVILSDIYLKCRKTIQEKNLLAKFEEKLLAAVEGNGQLDKIQFISNADNLDVSVALTLKEAVSNFTTNTIKEGFVLPTLDDDVPVVKTEPDKTTTKIPKKWRK